MNHSFVVRNILSIYGLLAWVLSVIGTNALAQQTPTEFPVVQLSAGIYLIQAEVASTDPQREKGLMFRPELGINQGMVFLFDAPAVQSMWKT